MRSDSVLWVSDSVRIVQQVAVLEISDPPLDGFAMALNYYEIGQNSTPITVPRAGHTPACYEARRGGASGDRSLTSDVIQVM